MALPCITQSRTPAEIRAAVQYLVRNFDRDPVTYREILRDLVLCDPETFLKGAVPLLTSPEESRGGHYLLTLIVSHDLLLRALSSPVLTREDAVGIARAAMRVDSLADVALAKQLADSATDEGSPVLPEQAGRLMEILADISDGSRVLPSLMRMLRHPNPYLRSKAVKLIGRGSHSIKWVQNRLAEADPRIRANAIEAIWGLDTEEARALLQTALHDGNNRVAGNALVALYRIGDCASIPELIKMSSNTAALFRATAGWAMGETGDPRFTETVARLLRDSNSSVRTRALSALGRIKAAVAQSKQYRPWRVTALMLDNDSQKGPRRMQVSVCGQESAECARLLPTSFILSEDGQGVSNYKVTERPPAEAASVVFLFPRTSEYGLPWMDSLLESTAWKQPSDLWALMAYSPAAEAANTSLADEPPPFTANVQNLDGLVNQATARNASSDLWTSLWRAAKSDRGPSRGRRHVILFSDGETRGVAGYELISSLSSSGVLLQVVSRGPDPALEELCRRTRSHFAVVTDNTAIADRLSAAYLNLLARYEVSWPAPAAGAKELKLRLHASTGWGEVTVLLE